MKITSSTKYIVRHGGRAITHGATRENAHRLGARLGEGYEVWNRVTRRRSERV